MLSSCTSSPWYPAIFSEIALSPLYMAAVDKCTSVLCFEDLRLTDFRPKVNVSLQAPLHPLSSTALLLALPLHRHLLS